VKRVFSKEGNNEDISEVLQRGRSKSARQEGPVKRVFSKEEVLSLQNEPHEEASIYHHASSRTRSVKSLSPRASHKPVSGLRRIVSKVISHPRTVDVCEEPCELDIKIELLSTSDDLQRDARLRNACINEIITTEEEYLKTMHLLDKVFEDRMRGCKALQAPEVSALFNNLQSICLLSEQLLNDLAEETGRYPVDIGAVFVEHAHSLKMYATYCGQHDSGYFKLQELIEEDPSLRRFIKDAFGSVSDLMSSLQTYSIQPIQRVCRYPLLLKELLKHTAKDTHQAAALIDALDAVNTVVVDIDKSTLKAERMQVMLALREALSGVEMECLLKASRQFIFGGEVRELENGYVFHCICSDVWLRACCADQDLLGSTSGRLLDKSTIRHLPKIRPLSVNKLENVSIIPSPESLSILVQLPVPVTIICSSADEYAVWSKNLLAVV